MEHEHEKIAYVPSKGTYRIEVSITQSPSEEVGTPQYAQWVSDASSDEFALVDMQSPEKKKEKESEVSQEMREVDKDSGNDSMEDTEEKPIEGYSKKKKRNIVFRIISALYLSFIYVFRDLRRHKRGFIVGFLSIVMVVAVLVTLQSALVSIPLVLLKLSEENLGEMDFILTPEASGNNVEFLLNSTFVEKRIDGLEHIRGGSPRWIFPLNVREYNPENSSFNGSESISAEDVISVPALLIALDLTKEAKIGLGRAWPEEYNVLLEDEIIVSDGITTILGKGKGDYVELFFSISELLNVFMSSSGLRLEDELILGDLLGFLGMNTADILSFEPITITQPVNISVGDMINMTAVDPAIRNSTFGSLINITLFEELFNITLPSNAANQSFEDVVDLFLASEQPILNGTIMYVISVDNITIYFIDNTGVVTEIGQTNGTGSIMEEYYYALGNASVFIPPYERRVMIREVVDTSYGKWASAMGNTILLNNSYLVPYLIDFINDTDWDAIALDVINQTFANASALDGQIIQTATTGVLNLTTIEQLLNISLIDLIGNDNSLEDIVRETVTNATLELIDNTTDVIIDFMQNVTIEHYALMENVMADIDWRLDAYLGDASHIEEQKIELSDIIVPHLTDTMNPGKAAPLFETMAGMSFILLFLQTLFLLIFCIMIFVGCLVIYSLLVDDVEARTYEYGMLRALGMRQTNLIVLLVVHSFSFALPATAFGLIIAFILNGCINLYLSLYTYTPLDLIPDGIALLVGIGAGLFMPIIGNVIPIRRALSSTLRESLDISHGAGSKGSKVSMVRLSSINVDIWQLFFSSVSVVMAIVVYYLIPLTLVSERMEQFFQLLTGVLLFMFIGLSAASIVLTPMVEKVLPAMIIWWRERRILTLVASNLSSHSKRNRMTSTLFLFSVAYLLFSGIFIMQTTQNINALLSTVTGSDIVVSTLENPSASSSFDGDSTGQMFAEGEEVNFVYGLPEDELTDLLKKDYRVEGYSFLTFPMSNLERFDEFQIGNILGGAYSADADIVGIAENYLDSTLDKFAIVDEINRLVDTPDTLHESISGEPDVTRSLYENAGMIGGSYIGSTYYAPLFIAGSGFNSSTKASQIKESYLEYIDVVISEGIRDNAAVDTSSSLGLVSTTIDSQGRSRDHYHIAKAHAMVSKYPGFSFSSYSVFTSDSIVLVNMHDYLKLLQDDPEPILPVDADFKSIPKQKLMVRLREGVSDREVSLLINALTSVDDGIFAMDLGSLIEVIDNATFMILTLFNLISVIGLVLCFFSLWLSFAANVRENSWEFGVLRAVGCSALRLFRIYIYEALSVVLSSLIFGTVIGIVIATALTLQLNIFLENSFSFIFPWQLYLIIVTLSLITAVVGSFLPADGLRRKGITRVLRGET